MASRNGYSRRGRKETGAIHRNQAYIHGSAVRKVQEAAPVRRKEQEKERPKEHRKVSSRVRRNQQKALRIDLPYLVLLMAASCCTLFICINYLQVQTTTTRRMDRIEKLEKDLDSLRAENDTLQTRINTSVDLDYVYKVATEQLGMVYAGKNQVRMYHQTESEFVRQYEDIPTY
ncbi:MAG: cell division protein FtsL [Hungatella sp.]|jgi:cell division protein FtsB|nr:cell division protein FtsL [Hungatella sp.]